MVSLTSIFFAIFLLGINHQIDGKKYFGASQKSLNENGPPPSNKVALMARYVVHNSEWASVGTISSNPAIKGYPFVGLKSMSDGPVSNGTGVPYMLMTDMDVSMNDLNHDNRCTLFVSLAQGAYCKVKNYDPQDPRCARVMLSGTVEKLKKNSSEDNFARNSLYTRHPDMSWWPTDHNFFIAKLNIVQVGVLDFFGGIKYVTPSKYFAANTDSNSEADAIVEKLTRHIEVIQITF